MADGDEVQFKACKVHAPLGVDIAEVVTAREMTQTDLVLEHRAASTSVVGAVCRCVLRVQCQARQSPCLSAHLQRVRPRCHFGDHPARSTPRCVSPTSMPSLFSKGDIHACRRVITD